MSSQATCHGMYCIPGTHRASRGTYHETAHGMQCVAFPVGLPMACILPSHETSLPMGYRTFHGISDGTSHRPWDPMVLMSSHGTFAVGLPIPVIPFHGVYYEMPREAP